MTDPRRYRVAIDDDVMERIQHIAEKEFNRNATKAVNQLIRKALAARNQQTNGKAK
jgi:predicted transcriptional regulator